MLRIDRNDMPHLPRPVYEVLVERDGAEARVSVMVGGQDDLPHKTTLFDLESAGQFRQQVEAWLLSLPYFEPEHAQWVRAANECAERFSQHLFSDEASSLAANQ